MTDKTEQPAPGSAPGKITIDPRVAMEETAALADFYRNRSLLHAQAAFAERQKNAELGEAINLVQEQTNKVVAENEELRKAAEKPATPVKSDKTVN